MQITHARTRAAAIAAVLTLVLLGCTELRGGTASPDGGDGSVTDDGGGGMSGQSGMSSGGDGGDGGMPEPQQPRIHGFSTLGEPRSGGGITLRDDGFETGARRCTANGSLCVTGGFVP